jgi:gamma-glutamyltranspeptidase/glutathione hydrolase
MDATARHSARLVGSAGVATLLLVGCAGIWIYTSPPAPEELRASEARSDYGMVASGSEEATRAGVTILEQGGTAVDAAVAVALALGAADPVGSGLGGMTYVLIHLADGRAVAIDGTAPVPLRVDPRRLRIIQRDDRLFGHATAAVPSTLATLDHALRRYGTMSLPQVLQPAIAIADHGYRLSPHQVTWLENYLEPILASRHLRFVVLDNGDEVGRPGTRYCQPELADTLRKIADGGVDSFHRGSIGRQIAADMFEHGGFVDRADFALLRVRELEPLRAEYRGVQLLTFPAPGGGGALVEALNILERFPEPLLASDSVERLHLAVEAFRIARADHSRYAPDPNRSLGQSDLPYLGDDFAARRAALITPGRATPDAELTATASFRSIGDNTTQVSVVDRFGNAVSLTQTLGRQYGAKVMTPGLGFPYNSLLEFFEFEDPASPSYPRPRARYPTDMAPTIVLDGGEFRMALGSAGSERIPQAVALVISNMIDRGMGLRDAITAPRVLWGGTDPARPYLEMARPHRRADADALERFGLGEVYRLQFPPRQIDLTFFGGVNAVSFEPDLGTFVGVGDPRRNGFALGPATVSEIPPPR